MVCVSNQTVASLFRPPCRPICVYVLL